MGRRLGQHWLTDRDVALRIADTLAPRADEAVLEIGGGRGALTLPLSTRGRRRVVIELDTDCAAGLRERFGAAIEVVEADVLQVHLPTLGEASWAVGGNLPYYATSPILLWLCDQAAWIDRAVVMIQAEVAERIAAPAGTRACGRISVALQYRWDLRVCFGVEPGAFAPPPKVESAVVELRRRPSPAAAVDDEPWFFRLVELGFRWRRKTLSTALSMGVARPREAVDAALRAAGIEPSRRAETLLLPEWAALAHQLPRG